MKVFTTPAEFRSWSRAVRAEGRRVGLVPTMGALHEGHLALVDCAREHADEVAVTIFVNPLQFNRADDFTAYPRPIDDDLRLCAANGVAAVYAPTAAVMYPDGFQTHVEPGELASVLEGAQRPGHFRGVATVVSKLFNAAEADVAVFGQKDFQQLAVIRRMVADLDMGVRIIGMPTVREADGLAMSSRNQRLGPADRARAPRLHQALQAVARTAFQGSVDRARQAGLEVLAADPEIRLDHLGIAHPDTLAPLEAWDGLDRAVALIAAEVGPVRLIDNLELRRG